MSARSRATSPVVLLAGVVGVLTFIYPFFLPLIGQEERLTGRGVEVPILFAILGVACLVAIIAAIHDRAIGGGAASKTVALLGVLVAVDAALRLVPSLLGASPIFLLIILVGYVFGANIGFLMGALTLLVSAFITGGIGPWLPFQMLTAGWVGQTAGWLPRLSGRRETALLAAFGAFWGFLFGAIMNLWSWPFAAPGIDVATGLYWVPGMTLGETIRTYARFYLVTSLVYDLFRALGNLVLVLLLAQPVIALLDRFRDRFSWQPWEAWESAAAPRES